MKYKLMLIAGCSHAAGSEMDGSEDSFYNRQNSFGNILAKRLGYTPINICLNGNTNSGIARSVLYWIEKHYNPTTMDLAALVSWTESTRVEAPSNHIKSYDLSSKCPDWFDDTCKKFFRINLGYDGYDDEEKEITKYFHQFIVRNNSFLEMMSANYVLQLQYLFKMHNIKYMMCNSLHMFTLPNSHVELYTNLIDKSHYYSWDNNDKSFFWHYRNAGYTNPKAKYWHHNEVPHSLYADELYRFAGENQCF